MDWSRYPLEKLFSFVAAIIPGATALLISWDKVGWLLSTGLLGYRTRIAVLLIAAFVIGFTMTTFLQALLGAIGGAIGTATYRPPHSYAIAPWRDPKWRELVRSALGANCPDDTRPISSVIFDLRMQIIGNLPKERQQQEILDPTVAMMMSIYVTLGVFLLLSVGDPMSHRSLISFAGWANLAHAGVMTVQAYRHVIRPRELVGVAVFAIVGLALIAIAPAKQTVRPASAARAA